MEYYYENFQWDAVIHSVIHSVMITSAFMCKSCLLHLVRDVNFVDVYIVNLLSGFCHFLHYKKPRSTQVLLIFGTMELLAAYVPTCKLVSVLFVSLSVSSSIALFLVTGHPNSNGLFANYMIFLVINHVAKGLERLLTVFWIAVSACYYYNFQQKSQIDSVMLPVLPLTLNVLVNGRMPGLAVFMCYSWFFLWTILKKDV